MTEETAPVTPPRLTRPQFHLWTEDGPTYVGVLTITNGDQLLAETQAKGLGIRPKESPFHLTALWVWAAAVRMDWTTAKFKDFTTAYAWEGIKDDDLDQEGEEDPEDPTFGAGEASTG